jgi:hypothetical protein
MGEKEDKKAQRDAEGKVAWLEYQAEQARVDKNTERLRKLRLGKEAREAAKPQPTPATKRPK